MSKRRAEYLRAKTPCPNCGSPKKKGSKLCRACYRIEPRERYSTDKRAARVLARAHFALPETCERCERAPAAERHHLDGDPFHNVASNIMGVCRRCHMVLDGRLDPPLAEVVPTEEHFMGLVA